MCHSFYTCSWFPSSLMSTLTGIRYSSFKNCKTGQPVPLHYDPHLPLTNPPYPSVCPYSKAYSLPPDQPLLLTPGCLQAMDTYQEIWATVALAKKVGEGRYAGKVGGEFEEIEVSDEIELVCQVESGIHVELYLLGHPCRKLFRVLITWRGSRNLRWLVVAIILPIHYFLNSTKNQSLIKTQKICQNMGNILNIFIPLGPKHLRRQSFQNKFLHLFQYYRCPLLHISSELIFISDTKRSEIFQSGRCKLAQIGMLAEAMDLVSWKRPLPQINWLPQHKQGPLRVCLQTCLQQEAQAPVQK